MRTISIAVLLAALAGGAAAQVAETIEVRITNVDVVVTDRAGKPVTGLKREDFQIFENGFEQSIKNFYELREDASSAAATVDAPDLPVERRRRRVVIFVDQSSVDPRRRTSAVAAAERALDKLLRPDDEGMVVTFVRDRQVVADLTPDREAVRRALRETGSQAALSGLRQSQRAHVVQNAVDNREFARLNPRIYPMPVAYRDSYAQATAFADELYADQKRLVAALRRTVASMVGLDGRKVLIFVGADLQVRPGVDVFDAVDSLFRMERGVMVKNAAYTGEATSRTLSREFEMLTREANANGVTLYLIDASDRGSLKDASQGAQIDVQGSFVNAGTDMESATSMVTLAAETGGRALVNSINFDLAMEGVVRDLGSYYSLGYRPPNGMGERSIKVKMKKPGLTARSRRGYTLRTADEELGDRVLANAFNPRMSSDMPVTVEVGKATPDGDVFRVPVIVRLAADVTTIPTGTDQSGELVLYFVTASTDGGRYSPVVKDVQPFTYSDAEAGARRGRPFLYTGSLRVRAGEQVVSVAVVDRLGGRFGFARAKFRAP